MKVAALLYLIATVVTAGTNNGYELKQWADADDRVKAGSTFYRDREAGMFWIGYVTGVIETAVTGKLLCPPTMAMDLERVHAFIKKFLSLHRERLQEPAHHLIVTALQPLYPCN